MLRKYEVKMQIKDIIQLLSICNLLQNFLIHFIHICQNKGCNLYLLAQIYVKMKTILQQQKIPEFLSRTPTYVTKRLLISTFHQISQIQTHSSPILLFHDAEKISLSFASFPQVCVEFTRASAAQIGKLLIIIFLRRLFHIIESEIFHNLDLF